MVFEISKLFKTLIKNNYLCMYWSAHKTATLTSIQHTVEGENPKYMDDP